MKIWRLLRPETNDAFTNMAIDEAIVEARVMNAVPNTLRFYQWKPSAVSVGRFQDVLKEVHVENSRQHGVDIVRRVTGGGAVYHDSRNEITYSVVAREQDFGTADVLYAYHIICSGLIEAARILGVDACFNSGDPRNCPNISINRKKISGSAQYHKGGVLLQHGTFLLNVELESMFTFLRVPWAKTVNDVVCIAKDRLTSVSKELDHSVTVEETREALTLGFKKALGIDLQEGNLTEQERNLASKLREGKYLRDNWNLNGKP